MIDIGTTRMQDAEGFTGTIVYVGSVPSAKNSNEQYAGIIWDDPTRGKHDGSVVCRQTSRLVRLFACDHATGASFIRLSKLYLGETLTPHLLQTRYVEMASAERVAPDNVLPHVAKTASGRDKPIEFLGEMKIRQYQQIEDLHSIGLRRMAIRNVLRIDSGAINSWSATATQLLEMDLAGNLLASWEPVRDVLHIFSNLQSLSLTCNRLNDLPPDMLSRHDNVMQINLHQTNISSVQTLLRVGEALPNLRELSVAQCRLVDLNQSHKDALASAFSNLQVLDLSDCQLVSDQTASLMRISSLERLLLDDNPIKLLCCEDSGLGKLRHWQLAGTEIDSWRSLEALNTFPLLKSLRLRSCPLTNKLGPESSRSMLIARFPQLNMVNASNVSEKERVEAERRYVSVILRQQQQQSLRVNQHPTGTFSNDREVVVIDSSEHPQLDRLRTKYQAGAWSSSNSTNGSLSLADTVLNVTIRSMAASSCTMEPLIRRLPSGMSVGRLKALCARAFGLDWDLQTLHWQTSESAFPTAMDEDDRDLAYFGIPMHGAEILMNERAFPTLNRGEQAQQAKEALEKRITEQEAELVAFQQRQMTHGVISLVPAAATSNHERLP
jgi:hypothetical protein